MVALLNAYTTLADVKERSSIRDTMDDPALTTLINAVSRQIDDYCRRRFYARTMTRYFTPRSSSRLLLDYDLLSVTTLKTDENGDRTFPFTWTAATDYYLGPPNNPADGLPYWEICVDPHGAYWFPTAHQRGVEIAGSWGYSATAPLVVQEACIAQVELMLRAPDVVLSGDTGGPMLAQLRGVGLHPFVKRLLDPFKTEQVG